MAKTVLGIFSSRLDAEAAIDDLEDVGYRAQDISVMMRDMRDRSEYEEEPATPVADSAVSGAVTGGVIGGIAGLLIGIGAIAVPGIGALLIGGPLASALGITGAAATTVSGAATGVLAGGIIGALIGLGVPQEEAREYEESIKRGGILVAVSALEGQEEDVKALLEDNGAVQIRAIDIQLPEVEEEEGPSYEERPYLYAPVGAKGGKSRSGDKKQRTGKQEKTGTRNKE